MMAFSKNPKDYTILGIIPARKGSKSVSYKNIRLLNKKPLIAYTIEAALKSRYLSRIIVSTDGKKIARIAKKFKAEVPFIRPSYLAKDHTPTLPVIEHAVEFLEKKENYVPDIIVLLQPTSPLRKTQDIDNAVAKLIETKADSTISVCPVREHPILMKRLKGERLIPYTKIKEPTRRQDFPELFIINGAVYTFWRKTLLKHKSIYGKDVRAIFMDGRFSVDIDDVFDFKLAEFYLNKFKD